MKALITGANGFLGSAVLRLLVSEGYDVRVLVRPNADKRNLEKFDLKIIEGDLQNTESLKRAVDSCDQVFHVAADYRLWVPDPDQMYKTNIDGTQNLILAATDAGVEKIVYTSSVATLGTNEDGSPADETTPSLLQDMVGVYKRSKFLAEQTVKGLIKEKSSEIFNLNEPKSIRLEWFYSEDETKVTLIEVFVDKDGAKIRGDNFIASSIPAELQEMFEITNWMVLGKVKSDHKEILESLNATFYEFAGGFLK